MPQPGKTAEEMRAAIDRVIHHSTSVKTEGESYRLQNARRGAKPRKEEASS
ncbi:MAG: hypothetical protein JNJ88_01740 [Planctomycetes bacterium]|nr:hypothetical protein [Planctomycetota bacterium]